MKPGQKNEEENRKTENSVCGLCDTVKCSSKQCLNNSWRYEKSEWVGRAIQWNNAKHFPKLEKSWDIQLKEEHRTPKSQDQKRPQHITVNFKH